MIRLRSRPTADRGSRIAVSRSEKNEKKTRKSMSGIACPPNSAGQHLCLAVFDEGSEARCLVIKDTAYLTRSERIILRPGDIEMDAEAAATDGIFYYVTGSHSAKRKDCENNSESRHVVRFRVDHSTGRPLRSTGDPNGKLVDYADTGRLWTVMASFPALSDYVGDNMCLGHRSSYGRSAHCWQARRQY